MTLIVAERQLSLFTLSADEATVMNGLGGAIGDTQVIQFCHTYRNRSKGL
jgi:hypothetical protein